MTINDVQKVIRKVHPAYSTGELFIVFQYAQGDRRDAANFVVVITDGQSTTHSQTVIESQLLRGSGATVIVVGIERADRTELLDIATPHRAIQILDLHQTTKAAARVVEFLCM